MIVDGIVDDSSAIQLDMIVFISLDRAHFYLHVEPMHDYELVEVKILIFRALPLFPTYIGADV